MAKPQYTINRSTVTHKWRIICHKYGRCALIPRAESHDEAIALMDNHDRVWHTPSNNNN